VRARALHPDVIAVTSALLQVNCLLLRGPVESGAPADANPILQIKKVDPRATVGAASEETFVLDSPVLPEELEMLPSLLGQAGWPAPSGLLATHADWDHLLAPLAFPGAPIGLAESSVRRLAAEPGAAQRELRSFDEELYLDRERPLALGAPQALPVPGHLELGARSLQLHPTGGHTPDGMAVAAPWAGVLALGDYLSEIEIPMLNDGGDIDEYAATLERLRPLLADAEHIVPGHGPILDAARAETLLDEDLAYLASLAARRADAELPEGRRSREMRALHARNVARLGS
jgi:glyoxylase-like metal-dependent hydrolase (beta-lactamase superfamily II)